MAELEKRSIEREHLLTATETVHRKTRTELEEAQQRISDLNRVRANHDEHLQREREKVCIAVFKLTVSDGYSMRNYSELFRKKIQRFFS